jgi:hypothetical protein
MNSADIYEPANPVSEQKDGEDNGEPSLQSGTEQNFWEERHDEFAEVGQYRPRRQDKGLTTQVLAHHSSTFRERGTLTPAR